MTPELLQKIHDLLDFSEEDDVIFWAILLVGFFLLLRKCNLVLDSTNKFDPHKQLSWQDLEFKQDHIRVTLRWTKNSQFGNKLLVFALPLIEGSILCPVEAIFNILHFLPIVQGKSIIMRSDGMCFTYAQLQKRLADVSQQLNLTPKLTSHSLRAGGATAAFLAGVPTELIKILGHWNSDWLF